MFLEIYWSKFAGFIIFIGNDFFCVFLNLFLCPILWFSKQSIHILDRKPYEFHENEKVYNHTQSSHSQIYIHRASGAHLTSYILVLSIDQSEGQWYSYWSQPSILQKSYRHLMIYTIY